MSVADEIKKLHELRESGALSSEEFENAKARLLAQSRESQSALLNHFRLLDTDKWIAGVCGGIGKLTGMESWIWRLIFVLGLFFWGFTLLLYILLWIFVPREPVA